MVNEGACELRSGCKFVRFTARSSATQRRSKTSGTTGRSPRCVWGEGELGRRTVGRDWAARRSETLESSRRPSIRKDINLFSCSSEGTVRQLLVRISLNEKGRALCTEEAEFYCMLRSLNISLIFSTDARCMMRVLALCIFILDPDDLA